MRLAGVGASYGGTPSLTAVDLEVRAGEAILLIGPSGSGKSTLALLLAGLIPGSVEADVTGEIFRHPALARPGAVGYVFQNPEEQFCQLTLGREVAFGLENSGVPTAAMAPRVEQALRTVGLAVDPEETHAALSGGMQQKLAIAAALAMEPDLLILDEPTANLDPESAARVFAQIRALRDEGRTLIVIEHRFQALLPILPRVVALDAAGRVACDGDTRREIAERRAWLVASGVLPRWQGEEGPPRRAERAPIDRESAFRMERGGFTYASRAEQRRLRRLRREPRFAFRDVSLEIPRGALTAIVGPNGSGKSTLLRVLAGFDRLTEGSRWALDREPAFSFQNPEHQFIHERVADELASRYLGDGPVPQEIQGLLREFGLEGHEGQSPFALSQGQKRRLSVAAMLVREHAAYLLDEPTFGQDARTQEAVVERLTALVRSGRSVVLTTHDMDLVRRHAQHAVVVQEGSVLFAGPPQALFARRDILRRAQLLADRQEDGADDPAGGTSADAVQGFGQRFVRITERQALSPVGRRNPGLKLAATLLAMGVSLFAHTIAQGLLLCALAVALLLFGARLRPGAVAVRLAPFAAFFLAYVWTLTAFGAAPAGSPSLRFLFFRLSLAGLHAGIVLALRMLSSVGFAVLFASTTDVTDLVVSACQNFRAPPKFAYGTLAGLRFFPLFEEEWQKLRRARALRGRRERWRLARVATYALPLLSQAIRLGERVAIAMESRGFRGPPAESPSGRTYYRPTVVGARDWIWLAAMPLACGLMLWLGR